MRKLRTGISAGGKRIRQALLVGAALVALAPVSRALDTQDIVVQWTDAGKQLAQQRVATWKTREEMLLIPAGEFVMGSAGGVDHWNYLIGFRCAQDARDAVTVNREAPMESGTSASFRE